MLYGKYKAEKVNNCFSVLLIETGTLHLKKPFDLNERKILFMVPRIRKL